MAIDYAKYDGHTPGLWQSYHGYLVRMCNGDTCTPIAEMRTPFRYGVGWARGGNEEASNIELLADAPMLLAKCKEYEEILKKSLAMLEDYCESCERCEIGKETSTCNHGRTIGQIRQVLK